MNNAREVVAEILIEYGAAWRHDWSDVDGRCIRDDMEMLASALSRYGVQKEYLRSYLCLCPAGLGHWEGHCTTECEAKA